jgi:hypothetical protein
MSSALPTAEAKLTTILPPGNDEEQEVTFVISRPTPGGAAAEERDWHRAGRMDCISSAPPAGKRRYYRSVARPPGERRSSDHVRQALMRPTDGKNLGVLDLRSYLRSARVFADAAARLAQASGVFDGGGVLVGSVVLEMHSQLAAVCPCRSSIAHGAGDGAHHVTVLTLWALRSGASTTEMTRSTTASDNVAHALPDHFPREEKVRNDGAPN